MPVAAQRAMTARESGLLAVLSLPAISALYIQLIMLC